MKVTMIGTSGSGKTVFSAGVYAKLMRRSCNDFQIVPRADNFASEMLETHKFARDYKKLAERIWPDGTTDTTYYPLNLFYNGKSIAYFDWIDYRGGFLDNPELDPTRAEEVHANIAASNAVILFADAEKLTRYDDPDEAGYRSGAECVIQILNGYSRNYPNHNLTFIIALTKADAVENRWKGEKGDYGPLMTYGQSVFEPLKSTFKREYKWRGGIIPVSTMGEQNVDSQGQIIGFPKPFNIEHVIFYSIGSTLRYDREDLIDSIVSLENSKQEIQLKYKGFMGTVRKTFQILRNTYSDGELLEKIREEQLSDYNEFRKIRDVIEPLERTALERVRIIT